MNLNDKDLPWVTHWVCFPDEFSGRLGQVYEGKLEDCRMHLRKLLGISHIGFYLHRIRFSGHKFLLSRPR